MSIENNKSLQQAWLSDRKKEWENISESKDFEDVSSFFHNIIDHASKIDESSLVLEFLLFLESCYKEINGFPNILFGLYGLTSLGLSAYKNHEYQNAEVAFRILSDSGDSNGLNNYAYMMRRGEISDPENNSPLKALKILREEFCNTEPFMCINISLTLALCYGTDNDWHLADDIIKLIPNNNVSGVINWWSDIENVGTTECLVVHLLLLRNKLIEESTFGTKEEIIKKLKKEKFNIPKWI
ncbi:MAG: hypothetical protein E7571_00250 [Ruminococcaceae bacterium]|nr:hypothetical protein [Oscillospiraceae bacterium]